MQTKRAKKMLALLLAATTSFTALAGWQGKTPETKAAIYEGADLVLRDPIIQKDEKMRAGQKATYDCLCFGNYPQAEVVSTTMEKNIDKSYIKEEDVIADDAAYAALTAVADSAWSADNEITIDDKKYRRVRSSPRELYGTSGSDATYHYFLYQPIKWRILQIEEKSAFLVADKALDCQQYNTTGDIVTWETSTVRSWLNGYDKTKNIGKADYTENNFISDALTEEEQKVVIDTKVINDDGLGGSGDGINDGKGGKDTVDKLFLLSQSEICNTSECKPNKKFAQKYHASYGFASKDSTQDEARTCGSSAYVKAKGVNWRKDSGLEGNVLWWLRSPGSYGAIASYVWENGEISTYGSAVRSETIAIRPALWIDLSYRNLYDYAGTAGTDGSIMPALKHIKLSPKTTQVVKGTKKLIKLKHVRAWNKAKGKIKKVRWSVRKQDKSKVKIKKRTGKYNRIAVIQVKGVGSYELIAKFNGKKYICSVSGVTTITKPDTEDADYYEDEEAAEDGDGGFDLEKNGYSFSNASYTFGYDAYIRDDASEEEEETNGYFIPLKRYQEVFGKSITKDLYKHKVYGARKWNGNCFGMVLSSILFYEDKLELDSYSDIAIRGVNESCYDFFDVEDDVHLYTDSELTAIIERYQIAQSSDGCKRLRKESMFRNTEGMAYLEKVTDANITRVLFQNVIADIKSERTPYILSVEWVKEEEYHEGETPKPTAHAMVVDSSRAVESLSDGTKPSYKGEGWYRIYLYDPNNPYSHKVYDSYNEYNINQANKEAKNRYIDVNINDGRWQIATSANSDSEAKLAGYDDEGGYIEGSKIGFCDADDLLGPRDGETTDDIYDSRYIEGSGYSKYIQTSFEEDDPKLWYFYDGTDTSLLQYTCDDFTITDTDGNIIFIMKDGIIIYQDKDRTEQILYEEYMEGYEPDIADGELILQGTGYTVHTESGGRIAFMENNVYKGVKAEGNLCITDSSTNGITVSAEKGTTANLLIETADDVDCTYTSVCMDVDIDTSDNVFSLKDNQFHGKVGKNQNLTVSVCTDDLGDYEVAGVTSAQLENWDVKAACPDKKDNPIISPDNTEEETVSTETSPAETKYIELPQEISVSEKTDTLAEDDKKEAYPVGTEFTDKKSTAVYIVTKRTDSGGTVTYVKPAKKNTVSVVIPDKVTVDGLTFKVTEIKDGAFLNNRKLKSVVIGKNITAIGKRAFSGCKNLRKITIKTKGLTAASVGKQAFKGIHKKAVIRVPKSRKKIYKKILQSRGAEGKVKIKK